MMSWHACMYTYGSTYIVRDVHIFMQEQPTGWNLGRIGRSDWAMINHPPWIHRSSPCYPDRVESPRPTPTHPYQHDPPHAQDLCARCRVAAPATKYTCPARGLFEENRSRKHNPGRPHLKNVHGKPCTFARPVSSARR